jgi:hypothetical protein
MDAEMRARADAFVEEAVTPPPAEKRALFREPPPPPEFPILAMGELRRAAEGVHVLTQAPLAMCAQSVLAAVALVVQPHRDVILPGTGHRPLTGLFLSVAASGERKTGVDRLALRAVHAFERSLDEAHEAEQSAYLNDAEAWKAARAAAIKSAKGNRAAIRKALAELGPEPRKPPAPMLMVADPTPEALVLHLADRPWGGLFTSEGGLFLGGAAFNDDTRLRTGALLNTLWDGEAIRRLRIVTGNAYLPGRRCTVHIMLQPTLVGRLFGDAELTGIGVLARALTVFPDSTAGSRIYRPADPVAEAVLVDYDARLAVWLSRTPRTRDGNPDALDPEPVPLSAEAERQWIAFYNEVERAQRDDGNMASIRAFASKLAEHAGRLSALLALYADPDAIEVDGDAMAGGIALARHYCAEMQRLHGTAGISAELQRGADLLRWWQGTGAKEMHLARAYQYGPNALRSADTARAAFKVLMDHGWAMPMRAGAMVDGAKRSEAWRLVD